MGLLAAAGNDAASIVVSGTFTGTGQSGNATTGFGLGKTGGEGGHAPMGGNPGVTVAPRFFQEFNLALWGTFVATIQLEKTYDAGATWLPCCEDNTGTAAAYTGPVNLSGFEPEYGVQYRWNCTAFTSGTVNYRISQ